MKMNYRKQYLFASAIQIVALVLLCVLLFVPHIYAADGNGDMEPMEPTLCDPTEGPTDDPTEEPTQEQTEVPTEDPTEAPTEPPEMPMIAVIDVDSLNIRESAHPSSRKIGRYLRGARVSILEQKTVNGESWGRTNKGWICLSYVRVGNHSLEINPFDQDDFVKDGYFISCKTEKTAVGIDVSKWQPYIDWEKLKAGGVDYVMIRAGRRGTSMEGSLVVDDLVAKHYAGAKAAGLKIGFYFYSQARTVAEAQEEVSFFLEIIKDYDVDLPLVCDWEYANKKANPRVHGMSKQQITDCIRTFCEDVKAAGYYPMAYLNNYVFSSKVYLDELADYGLWYADYHNYLNAGFRVDMWQYTSTGRVPGIPGNVDMNVLFLENSIFAEIFAEDASLSE